MVFSPHILFTTKHLAYDRAMDRDLNINHVVHCARNGIEHPAGGGRIFHDAPLLHEPNVTIRVLTDGARKAAITAYYVPTDTAVQEREETQRRANEARESEHAQSAAATQSKQKTAKSKSEQRSKQMARSHAAGEHREPHPKCPDCQ